MSRLDVSRLKSAIEGYPDEILEMDDVVTLDVLLASVRTALAPHVSSTTLLPTDRAPLYILVDAVAGDQLATSLRDVVVRLGKHIRDARYHNDADVDLANQDLQTFRIIMREVATTIKHKKQP